MKKNGNSSNCEEKKPLLKSNGFSNYDLTSMSDSDSSSSVFTIEEHDVWKIEYDFLKNYTQRAINNIETVIENINLLNTELGKFKENQNNGNVINLLELYKYLTVMQNFVDDSKQKNHNSRNLLNTTYKIAWGLAELYIGIIGKNLQRVVSNYAIDGKEHTVWEYFAAIFLNWQNYLTVIIDNALSTFLTSAVSNWSRDVIFDKQKNVNPFDIKQFNCDGLQRYKDFFQELLNKGNYSELTNCFSQVNVINNLMEKFIAINTNSNFPYHKNFTKEVENIKENIIENTTDIEQAIISANKTIKQFDKPSAENLTLTSKSPCYIVNDLLLEILTWSISHTMISGASANTTHDDFTISDWPEYIFNWGSFAANGSRYFVMRQVNNIFKAGLTNLGVPTNFCPKKFEKWITKQSRNKKSLMAIPLFILITVVTNIVKTTASLVTEYGFEKWLPILKTRLEKPITWLFFSLTTASDMVIFAVSDFYKIFNQFSIKNILKCFGFNKEELSLLEDTLKLLEKTNKISSFEEYKKSQEYENNNNIVSDFGVSGYENVNSREENGINDYLQQHLKNEKQGNYSTSGIGSSLGAL